MELFKPKIGLALGSGGPRGLAHLGVLKVLEKHKIVIDFIAGSSAGSIAGGFYAAYKNTRIMEEYILNKSWLQMLSIFLDPSFSQGLLSGSKLKNFLDNFLNGITFDKLKIPFTAVSVDLSDGTLAPVNDGDVSTAILASCGMPFLFSPVFHNEHWLVDGGVLEPVPVDIVRQMGADFVIGVNLFDTMSPLDMDKKLHIHTVAERSISIITHKLARYNEEKADIVVHPHVGHIRWKNLLNKEIRRKTIEAGEKAMEDAMPLLEQMLFKKRYSFFFKIISNRISRFIHKIL